MALLAKNKESFPRFYGWFQDASSVYIAMEHFPLGDLYHCVSSALPQQQASEITLQVATALEIMHLKKIAHRDLKPNNILVRRGPPMWQVAVPDFGISKTIRGIATLTLLRGALLQEKCLPEITTKKMLSKNQCYRPQC